MEDKEIINEMMEHVRSLSDPEIVSDEDALNRGIAACEFYDKTPRLQRQKKSNPANSVKPAFDEILIEKTPARSEQINRIWNEIKKERER